MTTIREILQDGPPCVWHVPPEATAYEVLELMATRHVGAVPVVEQGRLVGILSERDCARHLVLKQLFARETEVRALMSSPVLHVGLEHTIDDCMALMNERHVRHLPVLEGHALVGVVSLRDIVRHLISGRDQAIEELEHYIKGTG